MSAIKSPEARSRNMAAIKGKDTKPEIYLRKKLFKKGFRYRVHSSSVPGHPDIYSKKYNLAIFVNGCFWHRHKGCKYAYMPKSRIEFWQKKFNANTNRDQQVYAQLKEKGVRCLIVWECAIKAAFHSPETEDQLIDSICAFINSSDSFLEI